MKNLGPLFLITSLTLTACNVEQTTTDFQVTVKPLAGETVTTSTDEDTDVLISYNIDEDSEMPELSFNVVDKPDYGELKNCKYTSKTSWECTYSPYLNFNGEDKIGFKTKNGDFESDDKSYINLTVNPVPDAPVVSGNQSFTVTENHSLTFSIKKADDPDTESADINYEVLTSPENGTLSDCFQSSGSLECTYTPTAEFVGTDSFTYTVSDDETKSLSDEKKSQATVTFTVLREWISVSGVSSIKLEDKASNALIVFALDTSGSMGPYLDHMKSSVSNFIDDIAQRGFKATLAFITSDQLSGTSWKDSYSITKPHPDYPTYSNSYLQEWKRIPTSDAVTIYEIDAYDYDWNSETQTSIESTKEEVLNFISSLPEGSDDERLLCSTIRFLNSSYADDKNYVGVFSIANEDDAVTAETVSKAFTDCRKSKTVERIPEASCSATVSCEEGDENCVANWIYTYTKVTENPYPAEFKGTCEKEVTNYVEQEQARRKGTNATQKYKTVTETVCVEEDKVIENWRKGSKNVTKYKTVSNTECREEWKTYTTYRKGSIKEPKYITEEYEECNLEWETLDNPSGCKTLTRQVQDGYYDEEDKDEKGSCSDLSTEELAIWVSCTDYSKETNDGCKTTTSQVEDGYNVVETDEQGQCSALTETWNSCTDYEYVADDGCDEVQTRVEDGFSYSSVDQAGTCATKPDSWTECTDYTKTVSVADGTTTEEYSCTTTGGSTCDDHTDFFSSNCEKTKEAGYNEPTLESGLTKESSQKKTCLEVTGYDTCESIQWDGSKTVSTTEGCALQSAKTTINYFSVDDAKTQSLANSVANHLDEVIKKGVYVNVSHNLSLNKAALAEAESQNLTLPSTSCSRYEERRAKFTSVVNGETKYLVDGVEFANVVSLLSEDQASSHSICSPDRYPSDKLDYLVGDAQLEFKVAEYDTYDNVQVSAVKLIYASGDEKTLSKGQYTYDEGHVTLVDSTLAKNLVEIQMTYSGYQK